MRRIVPFMQTKGPAHRREVFAKYQHMIDRPKVVSADQSEYTRMNNLYAGFNSISAIITMKRTEWTETPRPDDE